MKKLIGLQAELNITADDDVVHGIGKGLSNGSIAIGDLLNEVKPEIKALLQRALNDEFKPEVKPEEKKKDKE